MGRETAVDLLRRAVDELDGAIVVTDCQGIVVEWSRGAEELYGWEADDTVGRQILDVFVPAGQSADIAALPAGTSSGAIREGVSPVVRKDGTVVQVSLRDVPLHGAEGEVVGVLCIGRRFSTRPGLLGAPITDSSRIEALSAAARSIEHAVTLAEIVKVILEQGVPAVGAYAGLLVLDVGEGYLEVAGATGYPVEVAAAFRRLSPDDAHPLVEAATTGRTVHASSFDEIVERWPLVGTLSTPSKSVVCVPLIADEELLGVVGLSFSDPRKFSAEELVFLEALAASCAQAVARAQSFDGVVAALALLDTLFASAPVGLAFFDRDLRLRRVNATMAHIGGLDADLLVGRRLSDVRPDLAADVERVLRSVVDTSEPFLGHRIDTTAVDTAGPGVLSASYYPVRHSTGELLGVGMVVEDVTEKEERLAFLAAVTDDVSGVFDVKTACQAVANRSVEWLADIAVVHLAEGSGVVRVAAAASDHELLPLLARVRERPDAPFTRIPDVVRSGEVWRYERSIDADIGPGLADSDAEDAAIALGLTSLVVVPMIAHGRVIGTLTLGRRGGAPPNDAAVEVATAVGRRAAMAVENARLYIQQQAVVDAFQSVLVPPDLPTIEGVDLAVRYEAAGDGLVVGGDFYDAFPCAEDSWCLIIGDVCGTGPKAAAATAQVRAAARVEARHDCSPAAVVAGVAAELAAWEADRFCTMVVVVLHPPTADGLRRASVAVAGHPYPLVVRTDGSVEEVVGSGSLLGGDLGSPTSEVDLSLAPGDALVLYTDGVTESRRLDDEGRLELFGDDRLRQSLASAVSSGAVSAASLADAIEASAELFRAGPPVDDVAIVVLRRCT